jgi:predicted transcriptional regulator
MNTLKKLGFASSDQTPKATVRESSTLSQASSLGTATTFKSAFSEPIESYISELVDQFMDEIDVKSPQTFGVLEKTGEVKCERQKHVFAQRMIRAEKYDVNKAISRAVKYAVWREEIVPGGLAGIDQGVFPEQIEDNKVYLQLETKGRRPLLIVRVKNHRAGISSAEILKLFVIYCLEIATYLCDHPEYGNPEEGMSGGYIDVIFDARDMGWSNYDTSGLKNVFSVLANAYPERVHKIYMYNGPYLLDMLWKVVKPFVDPVSREKVEFSHGEKGKSLLEDVIGREYLPDDLEGTPIHHLKDQVLSVNYE